MDEFALLNFNGQLFNEVKMLDGTIFTVGQPYLQTAVTILEIKLFYGLIKITGDAGTPRYYRWEAVEYVDPL